MACRIQSHPMRKIELAGSGALGAPLKQEFSISAKFHHPRVLVSIAYIERSIARDRHRRRSIEMALIISRHAAIPQGQQELALMRELVDLLKRYVRQPHVIMTINGQAVWHREPVCAPAPKQSSAISVSYTHLRAH